LPSRHAAFGEAEQQALMRRIMEERHAVLRKQKRAALKAKREHAAVVARAEEAALRQKLQELVGLRFRSQLPRFALLVAKLGIPATEHDE